MNLIFVDTSALIALGNQRDSFHSQAIRIDRDIRKTRKHYVTTSAILLELGNSFSQQHLRATAAHIITSIQESKRWTLVHMDKEFFAEGVTLFNRMTDKEWGLVDCTSIIIAKKMGIAEVFSTDHHFEQAGFSILLHD